MKHFIIIALSFIAGWYANAQSDYTEMEVSIPGNPGTLKGSYIQTKPKSPIAALIIPGSGPTDRDGNSAMGFTNNSLKMVADALANAGISSLRIDKRGIAASKSAALKESDLTFDAFVKDAKSWIDLLADSLNHQSIVIIGHSQGSLAGMLAAKSNEKVSAFISMAGVSEPIDQTLLKQIKKQAPVLLDETEVILDSLRKGHRVNEVNPMLISIFRPSVQPFLINYMQYNPVEEIARLNIPTLIITGTTDMQVPTDDARALDSAATESSLVIIDQMNHVLKTAPEDMAKNGATYNQPDLPLAKELMPAIINFIKNLNQ